MASVDTGGGEEKKGKPKKQTLRVDFTPMVDMNMLLITFFMFCTTLSKPQVMDIVMPAKDVIKPEDKIADTKASKAITVILGEDNKVYYYTGLPNYQDYTSLHETTFAPQKGIRDVLLERNRVAVEKMRELRKEKQSNKKMTEEEFKERASKIKGDSESQVVVIKPTSEATYKNLVDMLDEMQICSVGKFAVVDMAEGDQYLLENLKTKGAYGAQAAPPKQ